MPRSGWRSMRSTGTTSRIAAMTKSCQRMRPSNFWKYHASISGTRDLHELRGLDARDAEVQPAARAVDDDRRTARRRRAAARRRRRAGPPARASVCGGMLRDDPHERPARSRSDMRPGWSRARCSGPPAENSVTSPTPTSSERAAEEEVVDAPREHLPHAARRARTTACAGRQSLSSSLACPGTATAGPGSVLAEQVVVEHLARDRRRGLRAEAAVLDEHRERDLRLVGRRVGDEQRVVAQALVDLAARRTSRPSASTPARCRSCRRDVYGAPANAARAGALLVHADQRVLDDRDVLGLDGERVRRLRRDRAAPRRSSGSRRTSRGAA